MQTQTTVKRFVVTHVGAATLAFGLLVSGVLGVAGLAGELNASALASGHKDAMLDATDHDAAIQTSSTPALTESWTLLADLTPVQQISISANAMSWTLLPDLTPVRMWR